MNVGIDLLIEAALRRLYDRRTRAGQIDMELYRRNVEELFAAVRQSMQGNPDKYDFGSPDHRLYVMLRHNVAVAMAFKNHHNTLDVAKELYGPDGQLRSFQEFKKATSGIMQDYNVRWLEAEHTTAVNTARMASKWVRFKRPGKLEYRTIGDDRVRDEHRVLNGTIRDIEDGFWQIYYPPNGWKCRCFVRWHPSDTPDAEPESLPKLPEEFRHNAGISGKIFDQSHPYFRLEPAYANLFDKLFTTAGQMTVSPEKFDANVAIFQSLKRNGDYSLFYANNNTAGFVFQHAKAHAVDLPANKRVGKVLADSGYAVEIQEHVEGGKNPELKINAVTSDLKKPMPDTPERKIPIKAFEYARDQDLDHCVIWLTQKEYDQAELTRGFYTAFHNKKSMNAAVVVFNKKSVELTRKDFEDGKIADKLTALFE